MEENTILIEETALYRLFSDYGTEKPNVVGSYVERFSGMAGDFPIEELCNGIHRLILGVGLVDACLEIAGCEDVIEILDILEVAEEDRRFCIQKSMMFTGLMRSLSATVFESAA